MTETIARCRGIPWKSWPLYTAAMMLAGGFVCSAAQGGLIVQPIRIKTDMGRISTSFGFGPIESIINQSGLFPTYASGDDVEAYLLSQPTHTDFFNIIDGMNHRPDGWLSSLNHQSGNIDLDLGEMLTIDSLIVWGAINLEIITIKTDNSWEFSDPVEVVTLFLDSSPLTATVLPFDPVPTQFVRLHIDGGGQFSGAGEIAFGTGAAPSAVPEPSTLLLLIVGGVVILCCCAGRRRRPVLQA